MHTLHYLGFLFRELTHRSSSIRIHTYTTELTKVKNTPTDNDLARQVKETEAQVKKTLAYLEPLRSGQTLISPEEMGQLDADWTKWRAEWVARKKIYMKYVLPAVNLVFSLSVTPFRLSLRSIIVLET